MRKLHFNKENTIINERVETETNTNHIKLNTFKTNRTNTPNKNNKKTFNNNPNLKLIKKNNINTFTIFHLKIIINIFLIINNNFIFYI